MSKRIVMSGFVLSLAVSAGVSFADKSPTTAPAVKYASFGEAPKGGDVPVVAVDQLLAKVREYDGKYLRVTGRVSDVCAKKGCWLKLGDGEALFVKFTCPVGERLIPKEAVGKAAEVEGTVKVTQISEAQARHFKEDAGASPEEIAKIVGPQKQVTVASPSARVAGVAAPQAKDKAESGR